MISFIYSLMCGAVVLVLVHKMFRSDDFYEQLVCAVSMVPFILRALYIR